MIKDIAIILPYKEIYNIKNAGAAAIWIKDYDKFSKLKKRTIIYGNLNKNQKPISKNFKNIKLSNKVFSKNKEYIEYIYKEYLEL